MCVFQHVLDDGSCSQMALSLGWQEASPSHRATGKSNHYSLRLSSCGALQVQLQSKGVDGRRFPRGSAVPSSQPAGETGEDICVFVNKF